MRFLEIGDRRVGPGEPVYIVAEMSANHHQRFDEALAIVHAARDAGADAIKLQTYTADTLTIDCDNPQFRIGQGTLWSGRRLYDLYGEAYTPWEWQPRLKAAAEETGLQFFSTPFDETAVAFLESLDVGAYKIASFEVVDLPLLQRVASIGKPMIVSTGMATRAEIAEAVQTIRAAGDPPVALLKCTSAYPAPADTMDLRTIPDLTTSYDVPVGLSDHTTGIAVPVAAVALGACIIEKHLVLDRRTPGPDSAFSLEPAEFASMVEAVRTTERALGSVRYGPDAREAASLAFRRSLFVVQDVRAGEPFTTANVRSIRPAHGLHTRHLRDVLGRRATHDVPRGTPLSWDLVSGGDPDRPAC